MESIETNAGKPPKNSDWSNSKSYIWRKKRQYTQKVILWSGPHISSDGRTTVSIFDVSINELEHHKARRVVTVDNVWRSGYIALTPIVIGYLCTT